MEKEFKACSEEQLSEAAGFIRDNAEKNQVVLLYGELGSGKTALVRAYASLTGIKGVMSPTFNILHVYRDGEKRIAHADLYRLDSQKHIRELNLEETIEESDITFIEWAEKAENLFRSYPVMKVRIEFMNECRRIIVSWLR